MGGVTFVLRQTWIQILTLQVTWLLGNAVSLSVKMGAVTPASQGDEDWVTWRRKCGACSWYSAVPGSLTRNFRFCFQWLPWALVATWASVTVLMSSHSSSVGSGLCPMDFCSSSRRLFSRFSSISFLFASLLLSSSTTGRGRKMRRNTWTLADTWQTARAPRTTHARWLSRSCMVGHTGVFSPFGSKLPLTSYGPTWDLLPDSQCLASFSK